VSKLFAVIILGFLRNYFNKTKLFLNMYLFKFLDTLTKSFFLCKYQHLFIYLLRKNQFQIEQKKMTERKKIINLQMTHNTNNKYSHT